MVAPSPVPLSGMFPSTFLHLCLFSHVATTCRVYLLPLRPLAFP